MFNFLFLALLNLTPPTGRNLLRSPSLGKLTSAPWELSHPQHSVFTSSVTCLLLLLLCPSRVAARKCAVPV